MGTPDCVKNRIVPLLLERARDLVGIAREDNPVDIIVVRWRGT